MNKIISARKNNGKILEHNRLKPAFLDDSGTMFNTNRPSTYCNLKYVRVQ